MAKPSRETIPVRTATLGALTGALLTFTAPTTEAACQTRTCEERVARKQCTQRTVNACIRRAILTYRLNQAQAAWMWRVSWCESRRNPYARNPSGASGTFQFLASTWATTPYRRRSVFSAKWSSLGAAWMIGRAGRAREWVCG